MLVIARTLEELDFAQLMKIYIEGNQEHGEEFWPEKTPEEQIRLSELDFLSYLRDSFFAKQGTVYMIWQVDNRYVSALRLEPNRDGLLLEALETLPEERRKGYAISLIAAVQEWLRDSGKSKLYSHVSKKNVPSLKTHMHCGFEVYLDYAVYSDGRLNQNAYTMHYIV